MDPGEYRRRRRALAEQFQSDLDLVRAGYEAKLHALESLWLGEAGVEAPVPEATSSHVSRDETNAHETRHETPHETRPRARPGQVEDDLRDALDRLPDVFDHADVRQALGYKPARATLYRSLDTLRSEGLIAVVNYSTSTEPTRYRKVAAL